ncbi:uncharacterized protein LOC133196580 [Saccostrea echinata]|uniref:uncharacterized protein LOC133196580 n=1 Tax=Saccostrea echinata TaxID=191078 RepID=UPI002A80D092|nr:uncharacterized protein LOC133196580 [Saccostrea echinata]
MNFIEVGLPHTEFVPTKKEFTPRRPIPMSGLSKKYMGLETLSKSDLGSLIDRLSQPKTSSVHNSVTDTNTEQRCGSGTSGGRFTGNKKMKKSDLNSMIARLSSAKPERIPDARRIQTAEERSRRGVTASFAWQGKGPLRGSLCTSSHHTHYRDLLKKHSDNDWCREKN